MKRIPWRHILPLFNVALAGALLYVAVQQRKRDLAGILSAWDYVPAAELIADTINFPAALVWAPIASLLPDVKLMRDAGFLLSTYILWYLVAIRAFRRTISAVRRRRFAMVLIYACAIAGTAVVGIAAVSLWLHPLVELGGLAWCAYFTGSVAVSIFRRPKQQA
jgi:cation transport ATPase